MIGLPELLKSKLIDHRQLPLPKNNGSSMAAVLLPLVMEKGEWNLVLTRRTEFVSTHQNEVSFPGGSYDSMDVSLENTARRETHEEIGIDDRDITILGAMPTIETVTGFTVTPFVATLTWPTALNINKCEVDSLFTIPLGWLMSEENSFEEEYHSEKYGIRNVIHYADYKGEHVWGFTAKLIKELTKLIN